MTTHYFARQLTPSVRRFFGRTLVAWAIAGPHFVELIEIANLGAKHVDDNITEINQHPIARRQTLNARPASANLAKLFLQNVCDSSDVTIVAAVGDQHKVANSRFTRQIDRDDIIGLRLV